MRTMTDPKKKSWITVGGKLLLGVTLASNCFIGALLFINYESTIRIEAMMGKVLDIRERVDGNLRDMIVKLQKEFIALPHLFVVDPKKSILDQVQREFQVAGKQQVAGRDTYGQLFSRTEKRDLAKGQVVVQLDGGSPALSYVLTDGQGKNTDVVERLHLVSAHPEDDVARLQRLVAAAPAELNDAALLEKKINDLRKRAADKSIEAENTRTEILGYVDEINAMEHQMADTSKRQRRFSLLAGLATILGNIFVLFCLTRIIVEKPLHRLTGIVRELGAGKYPEIPWQNRRDQIGVLCLAIKRFREVLLALKQEEGRKAAERETIEKLVAAMTASIRHLDERAGLMTQLSLSLQNLADLTERESRNVADLAGDTASRTDKVSASSVQISEAVREIHQRLGGQSNEIGNIIHQIGQARQQLAELKQSVAEIDTIVAAVHAITDQTKILAINATIEAVKAGEYGRGFAVVAGEVKNLSQNTAHATRDVLTKIDSINVTCQAFIDCFDRIDQGTEQLNRATLAITDAVDLQQELASAIVGLTACTKDNTRQVSTKITEVNEAAGSVLQLSNDAHHCADEIAELLGTLRQGAVRELESLHGGNRLAVSM